MALSAKEQKELDRLELKQLEAEEAAASGTQAPKEDEGLWGDAKHVGLKGLEMAGRTADMLGGATRVAWTGLEDVPALTGMVDRKPTGKYPEDIYRALQGRAPNEDEYMDRWGIEPGASRTAAGIFKDIVKDPTTYMTGGASAIPKLMKAERAGKIAAKSAPVGKWGELSNKLNQMYDWAGKKSYKLGLKNLDLEMEKYGKNPVSDVFIEKREIGSPEGMDKLIEAYNKEADYILRKSTRAGGEINMNEAVAPLRAKIQELDNLNHPDAQAVAAAMKADLASLVSKGAKEPQQFLRELPVQAEYHGPRTEVKGFRPAEEKFVELPQQSGYVGPQSEVKGYRMPEDKFVELPTQAEYRGPYREVRKVGGKSNGLPVGKINPPGTQIAEDFRNWKKIQENPEAILTGQATDAMDEVMMGQLMPEKYTPRAAEVGFITEPGSSIPGGHIPEKYTPKRAEVGSYIEPGGAIPGKSISEEYIPRKSQTVIDETERISGPSTLHGNRMKSIEQKKVGKAYDKFADSSMYDDAQKAKAFGFRTATENSVERSVGKSYKDELRDLNDKLGRLLSSEDRAALDHAKEMRKNSISQVKGALLAADPKSAVAMKLAEIANKPQVRQRFGRALLNRSETPMLLEKNLLYSPWVELGRQSRQPPRDKE